MLDVMVGRERRKNFRTKDALSTGHARGSLLLVRGFIARTHLLIAATSLATSLTLAESIRLESTCSRAWHLWRSMGEVKAKHQLARWCLAGCLDSERQQRHPVQAVVPDASSRGRTQLNSIRRNETDQGLGASQFAAPGVSSTPAFGSPSRLLAGGAGRTLEKCKQFQ